MIYRCSMYLIGTSESIYASSHVVKFQHGQGYDLSLFDDINERFYDDFQGGARHRPQTSSR